MSIVALVVHHILSEPHLFRDDEKGFATNGYYKVALDGSSYGMGAASYMADGADREVVTKAIEIWKKKTKWREPDAPSIPKPKAQIYDEPLYQQFFNQVKASYVSYLLHKKPESLVENIGKSITNMDEQLGKLKKDRKLS